MSIDDELTQVIREAADLRTQRQNSADAEEQARLLAEIQALERRRRDLEAEIAQRENERIRRTAEQIDDVATARPHDALSALGRQARKVKKQDGRGS